MSPPNLAVSRDDARQKIRNQIEKGREIRNLSLRSERDLEEARAQRGKWNSYNVELLTRLFDNRSIAEEYEAWYGGFVVGELPLQSKIDEFREDMDTSLDRLESISERLELIPEPPAISPQRPSVQVTEIGHDIFIVHGQDEAVKESVARFIEKLRLRAVILHEQPNAGKTIIEKFETHANVGYAVVLLTPDDIGYPKAKPDEAKPHARQNVIFELGYFIGRLGRERVCALYKDMVELPSDFAGVLYVKLDDDGAWKLSLAKELKNAGFSVDMNKAV